jgi:ABC-type transporter Mla subunit MlaD
MAASKPTPVDELLARFQLENERAISKLRSEFQQQQGDLAMRVAKLTDVCTEMAATVNHQTQQLEDAVHHTRKGVDECNLAMKEAAKAAREAADSAAVFEKLKDSQPDFSRQVQALEVRIAAVVDRNSHLGEMLNGLTKRLDEFEVVADTMEETQGEVRGLDIGLKKLQAQERTSRPI